MKKMFYAAAAAVLLMASPAAQASGFTFHIEGQKIRIAVPRNCMSLSCLSITDNGSSINMKSMNVKGRKTSDDVEVASNAPQAAPPTPPVPAVQAQAARAAELRVGYDPIEGESPNPYHCEVWGTAPRAGKFTGAQEKALLNACGWYIPIEGVEIR